MTTDSAAPGTGSVPSDYTTEIDNYLGERRKLQETMAADARRGVSANDIARSVARVFGRNTVLEFVRAIEVYDTARAALASHRDLSEVIALRPPTIDPPRRVVAEFEADDDAAANQADAEQIRRLLLEVAIVVLVPKGVASLGDAVTDLAAGYPVHLDKHSVAAHRS